MLIAKNLTKRFGGKVALNNVSFAVAPGQIFCLLGANGAGKTTTINLFLSFLEPSEGEARIDGMNVHKHPQETKSVLAYIPENLMLYPNLTGLENLEYFAAMTGKELSKDACYTHLREAGLPLAAADHRVSQYSKGMRQKVGIAIAMAKDAKVLLLDEPTSGLDPKSSNEFASLLRALSGKGVATLMATHDLFRAKETGTHIGIMKEGNLVQMMSTEDLSHTDLEALYLRHMN